MITSHIQSFPPLQLLSSLRLTIPSMQEVPPGPGRSLENRVGSLCAVAHPYPSQLFPLKVPRHPYLLVFLQPPDFQDLPSLPRSLLQQRSSQFQDHLLSKTSLYRNPFQWKSFPNPQFSHFLHLKSLYAETQYLISLLISGFILRFFINVRIWVRTVLFSPDAEKFFKEKLSIHIYCCQQVVDFPLRIQEFNLWDSHTHRDTDTATDPHR